MALTTKEVIDIFVVVHFNMNYTTSVFDLTYTITRTSILTASDLVDKMILLESSILMQSNTTGQMYLYNFAQSTVGIVSNLIPKY